MIVVRSPLRISFVGGGSDIPAFCSEHVGVVVSAAIQHSVYVMVAPRHDNKIRVSYSKTEIVDSPSQIEHDIVRETMLTMGLYNIDRGIEIVSMADLPHSTGLGSSSAFTVGLVLALSEYVGRIPSREYLYNLSSIIEMERCKKPIGYQDQAASAYGGVNRFLFFSDGRCECDDMWFAYSNELENRCLLIDTGLKGLSSDVLEKQSLNIISDSRVRSSIQSMANLAFEFASYLRSGDIDMCGKVMNAAWSLKKSTEKSISSETINNLHYYAMNNGAIGGKLCGAGGRGMMLFICKEGERDRLAQAMLDHYKLRSITPSFSREGASIIWKSS